MSLVEALLPAAFGRNQRLERIGAQLEWVPKEAVLQPMRKVPTGRPAYPPLVQLKALLLQHPRGLLTAPAPQPALPVLLDSKGTACPIVTWRRCSPMTELPTVLWRWVEDAVPDATTLSRFRIDLAETGLAETVVDALNAQFEQRGLFIKAGTMVDAPPPASS